MINFTEMCSTSKEANTCNGNTKRRGTREGSENTSKELTIRNFPNVFYSVRARAHTHTHTHTHPRSSMKIKTRRKSWKQQEKGNPFGTNVPQQINSWLLTRYNRGHKAARCHISTCWKEKGKCKKENEQKQKLSTKNLISRKSVFQKWRWNKYIIW